MSSSDTFKTLAISSEQQGKSRAAVHSEELSVRNWAEITNI